MATEKQELARSRNWLKFKLMGITIRPFAEAKHCTLVERKLLNEMEKIRAQLVKEFDANSAELGLKVPEHRCWCGKEATIHQEDWEGTTCEWVCKKHKNKGSLD